MVTVTMLLSKMHHFIWQDNVISGQSATDGQQIFLLLCFRLCVDESMSLLLDEYK